MLKDLCCARPSKLKGPKLNFGGLGKRQAGPEVDIVSVEVSRAGGSLGLGLNNDNIVTAVTKGSPSETAGIRRGDKVVAVGEKDVGSRKLVSLLAENASASVTLKLERPRGTPRSPRDSMHSPIEAVTSLFKKGSYAAPGQDVRTFRLARIGDKALGMELDQFHKVTAVRIDSVAAKAGVLVGDVVTKIDGEDLDDKTADTLRKKVAVAAVLMLTVRRGISYETGVMSVEARGEVAAEI